MNTSLLVAVASIASLVLYVYSRRRKRRSAPLPPGPKPMPVIGNVKDLTAKELWVLATQWAKEYGDVTYLHVLGQGLVFLSGDALFDLLDKRGSIYSDKPALVMAGELCGCQDMVAFTRYGEQSRRQRKLMHRAFGLHQIPTYHPLLQLSTKPFLQSILSSPSDYQSHLRRYSGGVTLHVVFGHQVTSNDDRFLRLAEECVNILANEITSGGGLWPVDIFPSLKHLPTWFPGAGFKRKAAIWKAKMEEFVDRPYEHLKDTMKQGTAVPSFCSTLIEEEKSSGMLDERKEFDIKWTANSMYAASIDTTITTGTHFLLAMMSNPAVLARAQAEVDAVVGAGPARLPEFADRPNLPYVDALMSEMLRWSVPVPLGLPHRLMEDDFYRGMYIPKGSLIFANIWSMLRSEKFYPDPYTFDPERFLHKDENEKEGVEKEGGETNPDPRRFVFGFGRRRCPGANLVESSIWLLIASMVACFDISKEVGEDGNEVEFVPDFDNAVFRIPAPFPCKITPRSENAIKLIQGATASIDDF